MMGKVGKSWNNFPFNKALYYILYSVFYILKYLFPVNLPKQGIEVLRLDTIIYRDTET